MAIQPYINFGGNCKAAVAFYSEVFNAELQPIMRFGDVHNDEFPLSEEAKQMVMHTYLIINGTKVMFSDTPPGMPFVQGNNITLAIISDSIEEIKAIYDKLKVGGEINMALQETFWSKCYGNLTDQFGVGWQLSVTEE